MERLAAATHPGPQVHHPGRPSGGRHRPAGGFCVRGGAVGTVLPTSTGSNKLFTNGGWTRRAVTPNGAFKVNRKINAMRVSPAGRALQALLLQRGHRFPRKRLGTHGCRLARLREAADGLCHLVLRERIPDRPDGVRVRGAERREPAADHRGCSGADAHAHGRGSAGGADDDNIAASFRRLSLPTVPPLSRGRPFAPEPTEMPEPDESPSPDANRDDPWRRRPSP